MPRAAQQDGEFDFRLRDVLVSIQMPKSDRPCHRAGCSPALLLYMHSIQWDAKRSRCADIFKVYVSRVNETRLLNTAPSALGTLAHKGRCTFPFATFRDQTSVGYSEVARCHTVAHVPNRNHDDRRNAVSSAATTGLKWSILQDTRSTNHAAANEHATIHI
jgi:hypothetical protein